MSARAVESRDDLAADLDHARALVRGAAPEVATLDTEAVHSFRVAEADVPLRPAKQAVGERVLAELAERPAGARAIASRLGVPLRTVQAALRRMADEGACVPVREGNAVQYVIEDTVFSEPTRSRLRAYGERGFHGEP